jgi:SAM-dependent methyltransferase
MTTSTPAHTAPAMQVDESRDFRGYHAFLREARKFMETPVYEELYRAYRRTVETPGGRTPRTVNEAFAVMDTLPEFKLYCWLFRNLQRFKYTKNDLGIVGTVESQADRIAATINAAADDPGDELRLDPALQLPDYYTMVDFHQHPGGVWHDDVDGVIYDVARRTTLPSHMDPNGLYRLIFSNFPQREYRRVLDWGTGHGAGLLTWRDAHPESELHGVDLSAPCLKYAHLRAREAGVRVVFSQQDFEHLDYPDNSFDAIFFVFMLHELPPQHTEACIREAHRVLTPGGVMGGMELTLVPGEPFQNAVQLTDGWLNNEPYMATTLYTDYRAVAQKVGFSQVSVEPFRALMNAVPAVGAGIPPKMRWDMMLFTK